MTDNYKLTDIMHRRNNPNCPECGEILSSLQARPPTVISKYRVAVNPIHWKWCESCDMMHDIRKIEKFPAENHGPTILDSKIYPKISKISNKQWRSIR